MKIAILHRNGLGDLICTQPLIKYLQYKFPIAEIHLFIESNNKELADYLCPEVTIYPMDFKMHRDGKGVNPREHR